MKALNHKLKYKYVNRYITRWALIRHPFHLGLAPAAFDYISVKVMEIAPTLEAADLRNYYESVES